MRLAMTTLATLCVSVTAALADDWQHPCGLTIPLPEQWQVYSEGGLTALLPPDQARNADGPTEVYLVALGPTYGARRIDDRQLVQSLDAELRQTIPAVRLSDAQTMRAGDRDALVLEWTGTAPAGQSIAAQAIVVMGDGFTATIIAIAEASQLNARQETLRQMTAGLSMGEGTIDKSILGLWKYSNSSSYSSGYGEFAMSFASHSSGAIQLMPDGTFAMQDSSAIAGGGDAGSVSSEDNGGVVRGRWFARDGLICAIMEDGTVLNAQYSCDRSTLQIVSQVNDFKRRYRAAE